MSEYKKIMEKVKEINAQLNKISLKFYAEHDKEKLKEILKTLKNALVIISDYQLRKGLELSSDELNELMKYYQIFHGHYRRYENYA